jgi:hypothetical protein
MVGVVAFDRLRLTNSAVDALGKDGAVPHVVSCHVVPCRFTTDCFSSRLVSVDG